MKSKLLFLLLIQTQILTAQTFTEVSPSSELDGVKESSIAFSDVNGDGYDDVLITGASSGGLIAKLYTNDGTGNFTEMPGTPFDAVWYCSIAFSDVNGDGHNDVLITGATNTPSLIAKLYTNNGTGNFTQMPGPPFLGVQYGSIAFSDVNGDGHNDVLITGQIWSNGAGEPIAKLYTNDGTGNFTEMPDTPFDGVWYSSIAFSDVNGDGHDDILITGRNSSGGRIAKLYTNDGTGTFTEMQSSPFEGVSSSSIAFSDVNGDGHDDVLITGRNSSTQNIAKLYTNDGAGNFTEMMGTPFVGVWKSSIAFSDVNGDGHDDVIITGVNNSSERIAKLYTNDGTGTFTEMPGIPFDGVGYSSIVFSDVNGNGHDDILITGETSSGVRIAKLYTNDGTGTFTEIAPPLFDGVWKSSIAFSDVNSDGYDDVLITGMQYTLATFAKLYTNDGTGTFTEMPGTSFDGVRSGSIAFSDVNGDGHDDVLITGESWSTGSGNEIAKLYTNDGTGTFAEITGTPFQGVLFSSIAFSDVNGDGYNDVLITGETSSGVRIAKLYTNDGTGNFTEMTGTPFDAVSSGTIVFLDVNGDGHDDVLITGLNSSLERIAKLYTNDGTGTFTQMTGTPFDGVLSSSIAFSDVNGDGHNDVIITGVNNSSERIAKLYTNDGMGNFTEMTGTPFDGVSSSSIAFSDVNGDGHNDVLITGETSSGVRSAKLYTNNGTGTFTEITGTPFDGVREGSIAFSDVNGDGYNDVLITGVNSSSDLIAKLYTNDGVSSIEDLNIEMSLDFILFPNPSTPSTLLLSYNSTAMSEVTIKVYDINGHLQLQQKEYAVHGQQTFSIDVTTLSRGSYFLELDNGKSKGTGKFIK